MYILIKLFKAWKSGNHNTNLQHFVIHFSSLLLCKFAHHYIKENIFKKLYPNRTKKTNIQKLVEKNKITEIDKWQTTTQLYRFRLLLLKRTHLDSRASLCKLHWFRLWIISHNYLIQFATVCKFRDMKVTVKSSYNKLSFQSSFISIWMVKLILFSHKRQLCRLDGCSDLAVGC